MVKKWIKKIKNHFNEIIKTKTTPHSIALGFAIGTFLCIFPTPGFSFLLGLLVVLIFERVNKFSLFGSFIVWNPLVLTPIFYVGYQIGDLFYHFEPIQRFDIVILNQAFNFTRRLIIGNTILGIMIAVVSYYAVYIIVDIVQKKQVEKK